MRLPLGWFCLSRCGQCAAVCDYRWAGFAYPAVDSVQRYAAIDAANDAANDAAIDAANDATNDAANDAANEAAIDAANEVAIDAASDAANDYRRAGLPFPLRRQGWVAFPAA